MKTFFFEGIQNGKLKIYDNIGILCFRNLKNIVFLITISSNKVETSKNKYSFLKKSTVALKSIVSLGKSTVSTKSTLPLIEK